MYTKKEGQRCQEGSLARVLQVSTTRQQRHVIEEPESQPACDIQGTHSENM